MITLEVAQRDTNEAPEALRKRGFVPAVFYGPKEDATPISIDSLKLERLWREAGETTIVRLTGIGEEKDALIHDVQFHPVTGKVEHADFYVLEKGKKVTIKVPLEFTGQAPAEKSGHVVVKTLHEVEIEVAPQDLPHSLPVDLSSLVNVGDHIIASQISLPGSAALVTNADEIVVSVKEFKEEPTEVTPAPETVIIGEEKKAEEAAAAGTSDKKEEEK
ncbi:50S ribosomal protein L25 [Candidatus Parcubacteria bacterium]|nr:MAG: 50S ribosomal protein L25 [Candidatus Parcubacteria bacterium]